MKTKIEVVGEKDIWYWSAKRNGYVVASSVKKCRSKSALLRTLKSGSGLLSIKDSGLSAFHG